MPNPVTHFEVTGKDGPALQSFFADLFGWEIDADNPMNYGMVSAPEGRGIGGGVGANPMGVPSVTFYVEVPDLQASLDKAVELGGSVVMPVTEITEGTTIALFATSEGHVIGLAGGM